MGREDQFASGGKEKIGSGQDLSLIGTGYPGQVSIIITFSVSVSLSVFVSLCMCGVLWCMCVYAREHT